VHWNLLVCVHPINLNLALETNLKGTDFSYGFVRALRVAIHMSYHSRDQMEWQWCVATAYCLLVRKCGNI